MSRTLASRTLTGSPFFGDTNRWMLRSLARDWTQIGGVPPLANHQTYLFFDRESRRRKDSSGVRARSSTGSSAVARDSLFAGASTVDIRGRDRQMASSTNIRDASSSHEDLRLPVLAAVDGVRSVRDGDSPNNAL